MASELEAEVTYIEGLHFKGENPFGLGAHFDSKPLDEPGAGPTPMELLLQAAGACSGMDVVSILRKRHIELTFFKVILTGNKREEHPRIFTKISVIYRAKGQGLTQSELERAVNLSQSTYCSVFGMMKNTAQISWTCEVID